jgi:hypothetical protein
VALKPGNERLDVGPLDVGEPAFADRVEERDRVELKSLPVALAGRLAEPAPGAPGVAVDPFAGVLAERAARALGHRPERVGGLFGGARRRVGVAGAALAGAVADPLEAIADLEDAGRPRLGSLGLRH